MNAGLSFEIAVSQMAFDMNSCGFNAYFISFGTVEDFCFEFVLLGPTEVHAQKHFAEILGVFAAGASVDGENGVVGVVFGVEEGLDGEGGPFFGEFLNHEAVFFSGGGIVFGVDGFEEFKEVLAFFFNFLPLVDLLLDVIGFLGNFCCLIGVIPKPWGLHLILVLSEFSFECGEVEGLEAAGDFVLKMGEGGF